ncbi:MAG: hypothetical protein RIB61_03770 [Roseicyclus sp.]
MIELTEALPPGALCDAPDAALADDLAGCGVCWWAGSGLQADGRTGAVTAWAPHMGPRTALPTDPNEGNGLIGEAGDLTGLQLRDGRHCGMVVDEIAPEAAQITFALRYLPPHEGDARTVLTLNTGGAARKTPNENYLFVSEAGGMLTVKDDKDLVELTLPVPAGDAAPRLVMGGLAGDRLSVSVFGGPTARTQARAQVLTGSASLFIGCRNQRPGLLKTLGGALICDVWVWPGRCVPGSDAAEDRATLRAMERFHLWVRDS